MKELIDGVAVKPLKAIPDERGRVMEILRSDDAIFEKFGQCYVTTAYPGVVKAWHYHKVQTDYFCVVHGMMKVVLYDGRDGSRTKGSVNEFFAGVHNPVVIKIPPLVYHGFKTVSESEAVLINCPTEPYSAKDPDEYRLDAHTKDIPYAWERKDG